MSDSMRYEIGAELAEKIAGDNRFSAEIAPRYTSLPSVTAVGMAALLPRGESTLISAAEVLVDGADSSGLKNREKILRKVARAKALTAEDDFSAILLRDRAHPVDFDWSLDQSGGAHARHIITGSGWKIPLDRGLDIFQRLDCNDAFAAEGRFQELRPLKAFEITYLRVDKK